jgi:hypothetical protein
VGELRLGGNVGFSSAAVILCYGLDIERVLRVFCFALLLTVENNGG